MGLRPAVRALGAAALAAALAAACTPGDRPGDRPVASAAPSVRAGPRVVVELRRGGRATVTVEVVRSEAERERGLMFRSSLAADAGMLFVFDESSDHAFWMKNTLIPLDMIFIDEGGRIVGVVADATPGSLEPRSGGVSRFVLEVNAGWAKAQGVAAGDAVRFEGVPFP
jgi:uncharacterized membrane protein (UPF0127 family)